MTLQARTLTYLEADLVSEALAEVELHFSDRHAIVRPLGARAARHHTVQVQLNHLTTHGTTQLRSSSIT